MQCTGMNSGVGGHTAINEVCVCVCVCVCVQEMGRTNRKNSAAERIVT